MPAKIHPWTVALTGRKMTFEQAVRDLIIALAIILIAAFAFARPAAAAPDATASIIDGDSASISEWPWQVAVASSRSARSGSPRSRTFCGGSIVAPTIVLTAAHCAYDMRGSPSRFAVISGRTNLNAISTGQEVRIAALHFPRTRNGTIRYWWQAGWDVALLELSSPLAAQPIQLLGPDEGDATVPGTRLYETGWGTTVTGSNHVPKSLKVGGTNVQPPGICRARLGGATYFTPKLQVCLGDADGKQANCYGDSGGPAMVGTTAGFRQVGITSMGTAGDCAGRIANVDVLSSGKPVRSWIRSVVLSEAGINPVGSGGTFSPTTGLCPVPAVKGLRAGKARQAIRAAGCEKVRVKRRGKGNRVLRNPVPSGWLWNPNMAIRLLIGD